MKINLVKRKNDPPTTRWAKWEKLFVVVQKFNDGSWGFADCWEIPYVSKYYNVAVKYHRIICALAERNGWDRKNIRVAKISS